MSGWSGAIELAALVALAASAAIVASSAATSRLVLPHLLRRPPVRRGRWLLAWAAAPVAVPAFVTLLCLLPSTLAALGLHDDHCPHHAEHRHLCLTHRPPPLPEPWAAIGLLGLAPATMSLGLGAASAMRGRHLRSALRLGASGRLAPDVHRLDTDEPVSVTAGSLRPLIFVSDGLARALRTDQLEIVIAHERAHVRRRDGLRRVLASALSLFHWPSTRRRLLTELSRAHEEACDADAARSNGDPLAVAETILATERLLGDRIRTRAACAFGGSAVRARVRALIDRAEDDSAPAARPSWRSGASLAAAVLLVAGSLALADPLHHLAEHWLARLVQ